MGMFIRITDRAVGPPAGVIRSQRIKQIRQDEVGEISSLPEAEWALLSACVGPDWEDFPVEASIPQLIAEQLCTQPHATAVTADGKNLTYAQLWMRAGSVAARLRTAGVRRGHLVGLCCERSTELIVGMLGILRSGAAYVPMQSSYSAERMAFMHESIGLRLVVVQPDTELPGGSAYRTVIVESEPAALSDLDAGLLEDDPWAAGPDDLAYLSCPPGPVGEARTVMASHRSVLSLLNATRRFG
jgi:non-ribosomal peptide synthetase component F